MSLVSLLFLFTAVLTCGASIMVVTTKNMVQAALWLVLALFGGAVIFVLLQAPYIAVIQVVVYIGAIAVLVIFAVMLTRQTEGELLPGKTNQWPIAALLSAALFVGMAYFYLSSPRTALMAPVLDPKFDLIRELGQQLVSPNGYVLPFELASILLLAALIGSIVVAWRK